MPRLAREDWLDTGFALLAQESAQALTVERMTSELGVTKGSFYHHFDGFGDFKRRLLSYWEARLTADVIATAEEADHPAGVLSRFIETLTENPPDAERAIRAWALEDGEVRAHLARVDAMRLEQAADWFGAFLPEPEARVAAQSMSALLVGCYSIVPPVTDDELRAILLGFFARAGAPVPEEPGAG